MDSENQSRLRHVDRAAFYATKISLIAAAICALLAPLDASAQRVRSCNEAMAACRQEGAGKPNIAEKCVAAGAECARTGVFVGPVTGRKFIIRSR